MKLLFKQRFFSWFDSYNVYSLPDNADADSYELSDSDVRFVVEGQLALGHCFLISDSSGRELGRLEKRLFTLLPEYDIYIGSELYGTVEREFSLFHKSFNLDVRGWSISGDFLDWDYSIVDSSGSTVATIGKELLRLTDTYVLDIPDERDALCALMIAIAIDVERE